jgi:hypothetical protein
MAQTNELNLDGDNTTQGSPRLNLNLHYSADPPSIHQYSVGMGIDENNVPIIEQISNPCGVNATQWFWGRAYSPSGNSAMQFHSYEDYGALILSGESGLAYLTTEGALHLHKSKGPNLYSFNHVILGVDISQPAAGSAGLLINGQKALTVTEGDSRYLSSSWSSSILTQSSADARYLRTDGGGLQFGLNSSAAATHSIALGFAASANGLGAVALGASDQDTPGSFVPLSAVGKGSSAFGYGSRALEYATASGWRSEALGVGSIALGKANYTSATAEGGVALGGGSWATAAGAIAIGQANIASNSVSVAIGWGGTASGSVSTTLGALNMASGDVSLATGSQTVASGAFSVTMGRQTTAAGWAAMAIGEGTNASGDLSLAAGFQTKAIGGYSFAGGYFTEANGWNASALGRRTIANGSDQVVIGVYNAAISDANANVHTASDALLIVGNGYESTVNVPSSAVRSNAFVVRWNGDTESSGTVKSTAAGAGKYNKFKAPILVPESGDISMGEFTAGEQP